MNRTALRAVANELRFPECPRWRDGELWFAEKRAGRVRRLSSTDGEVRDALWVEGQPGGLGWDALGNLLVVSMAQRSLLRFDGTRAEIAADLSELTVGRCNDMVVDATGRAYVGHFGYDLLGGEDPAAASLVCVEEAREPRVVAEGLHFPNGMVITPNGRTLIVAESAANRLSAFEITGDGALGKRRVFAELGDTVPDGLCLDAEGAVWVADPLAGEVLRVVDGGRVLDRVSMEGAGAFACVLGGEDGRSLYVCTYTEAASMDPNAPPVGEIVEVRVEVPSGGSP